MKIAGMLLLLIMVSIGLSAVEAPGEPSTALETACQQDLTVEPSEKTEALLLSSLFEPAQESTCNCDTRCGVCGGRLRGCFNGIPFCECFQC